MAQMLVVSHLFTRNPRSFLRLNPGALCLRTRNPIRYFQAFRRRSSSVRPTKAIPSSAGRKPILPERLLVFHAGTGRSVFLGCWKVTTIFICAFFSLVMAPAHFQSEEQPKWVAPAVMLSGLVPVAFVAYVTSPFVAHIHLRLPPFARYSREVVVRYSQALPKDAKLELTTVNFIGMPRVSRINIADLHPAKERFGIVNYVRDTKYLNSKRPWWMGSAIRQFGVYDGVRIAQGSEIWENIARTIAKRSV